MLLGSEWSREETDYLWSLCRQFDLRWVVIADRFECPQHGVSCRHAGRSESMRARYYSIARHLAQQCVAAGQDAKKYPLLEFQVRKTKTKNNTVIIEVLIKNSVS